MDYIEEAEKIYREQFRKGHTTEASRARHLDYIKTSIPSSFANKWSCGQISIHRMPRPKGKICRDDKPLISDEFSTSTTIKELENLKNQIMELEGINSNLVAENNELKQRLSKEKKVPVYKKIFRRGK